MRHEVTSRQQQGRLAVSEKTVKRMGSGSWGIGHPLKRRASGVTDLGGDDDGDQSFHPEVEKKKTTNID